MEPQDIEDDAVAAANELLSTVEVRTTAARQRSDEYRRAGRSGPSGSKDRTLKMIEATNRSVDDAAHQTSVLSRLLKASTQREATARAVAASDSKRMYTNIDKNMAFLQKVFSKPLKIEQPKGPRARVQGAESTWVKRDRVRSQAVGGGAAGGILGALGSNVGLAEGILGLMGAKGLLGRRGGVTTGGTVAGAKKPSMLGRMAGAAGSALGGSKVGKVAKVLGLGTLAAGAGTMISGAAEKVGGWGSSLADKATDLFKGKGAADAAKAAAAVEKPAMAGAVASTAAKAGTVGKLLKGVPLLGTLLTGAAVLESETSDATRQEKNENLGGLAGGAAGGWAGAKGGLMAGAALGSVVPGVGTAIGGGLGAIIGGIAGSLIGDKLGRVLTPADDPGTVTKEEAAFDKRAAVIENSLAATKAAAQTQTTALEKNTEKLGEIEKSGWVDSLKNFSDKMRSDMAIGASKIGNAVAGVSDGIGNRIQQWTAAPEGAGTFRKAVASAGKSVAESFHTGATVTRAGTEMTANSIAGEGGGVAALVARHESGKAGYNAYNTGKVGQGKTPIDLENMTVGELKRRQALPKDDPERIFAAGKYQAIPSTMKEAQAKLGFKDDQKFTKELQDQIFTDYLVGAKRKDIQAYVSGKSDNLGAAEDGLAKEFASMYSPTKGKGWYDGDSAGNKASGRADKQLIAARAAYTKNIEAGMNEQDAYRSAILNSGPAKVTAEAKVETPANANAEAKSVPTEAKANPTAEAKAEPAQPVVKVEPVKTAERPMSLTYGVGTGIADLSSSAQATAAPVQSRVPVQAYAPTVKAPERNEDPIAKGLAEMQAQMRQDAALQLAAIEAGTAATKANKTKEQKPSAGAITLESVPPQIEDAGLWIVTRGI